MQIKYRQLFAGFAVLFLASALLLVSGHISPSESQNAKEQYQKVQRDLRKQKKKLAEATKTEKSVITDLRKVDSQLSDLQDQMTAKRDQIKSLKGNIAVLETEIAANSRDLESQKERLKTRLRTLQRINNEKEVILMLLSDEDPATVLRISRSLSEISNRYNESIKDYQEELSRLNGKKRKLDGLARDLKAEEQNLSRIEVAVMGKKKEKETLLVSVRKEKDTYQRMIEQMKSDSERLQKIIRESEKRERPSGKKGTRGTRTAAPELPEDNAFTRLKGRLPWPVTGKLAIRYGSQVDPLFNLPVFRSGVHIRTALGSTVTAVAGGKVVYAGEFKGYGQLVVISHGGGYHTLYGNLSKIFSANDAIIKENEAIGEVGESATLGASGLYFEIRYKGKPLDPQQWLNRSAGNN
ncbi:MAG TPA: peptidoglycan DD-metalloendopeptidase family protein [Dissulfurispiraceae bacterium]|nr:peptidoglycan DD-metalloendopeptidase family protein [Dissulfurispiraceae bacterium]